MSTNGAPGGEAWPGKDDEHRGGTVTEEPEVLWERRGRIRLMTLNRPAKRNAITLEGQLLQSQYLQEFAADDDAWALVVTGAGGVFSTGLDLSQAARAVGRTERPPGLTGHNPVQTWKPILAAVAGYALGGGLELALACDIRIAARDARFGFPEVKRSLIPGAGGCQRLARLVPRGTALRMLFTGDLIDAEEAYRIGLVEGIADGGSVLDETLALAESICANGPLAVRAVKESVYRGIDLPLGAALVQDNLFAFRNRQTEDAKEGPKAFLERRDPEYKAR